MEGPFIYDRYVTGKNFIGRSSDCTILANMLSQGEHIAIFEAPKSGVSSVIQQTLIGLRLSGRQFVSGQSTLLNIRTVADFLTSFGSAVIRAFSTTPDEYGKLMWEYLAGTHFVFDSAAYSEHDRIVSLNWDIDDADIRAMLELPFALARDRGVQFYYILDEFCNIDFFDDADKLLKLLRQAIETHRSAGERSFSMIFCGSRLNAMKEIFESGHLFDRKVEVFRLNPIESREIVDYIHRGFMHSGKESDKTMLLELCNIFRNNMFYINQTMSVCDSMSRGYIVENTIREAIDTVLSMHELRFRSLVFSLTSFQLSLLKAVLDGNVRINSIEVINRYGLNSPANVKRLKDALCKKEIISFNDKEEAYVIDPLFEYWVRKFYFEQSV